MTLPTASFLLAQAAPASPPPGGMLMSFLPFILIMAAMWFLIIAPQRKKQKEHTQMIGAVAVGDEVLTIGGIFGTVTNIKDDRFVVKVADNTRVEILKSAVQTRFPQDDKSKG